MKSDKIIALIRDKKEDKALRALYNYLPKVKKLICANNGTNEDALDIFQEALIIFCRKATKQNFQLTSSIDTYLYGVCRLLWNNELRKRKQNTTSLDIDIPDDVDIEQDIEQLSKFKQAEKALNQLGKKCLALLQSFYFKSMSMKAIALAFDFSSEKSARNQKYKCLEKAKQHYQTIQNTTI